MSEYDNESDDDDDEREAYLELFIGADDGEDYDDYPNEYDKIMNIDTSGRHDQKEQPTQLIHADDDDDDDVEICLERSSKEHRSKLSYFGVKIIKTLADGNCLLHALSPIARPDGGKNHDEQYSVDVEYERKCIYDIMINPDYRLKCATTQYGINNVDPHTNEVSDIDWERICTRVLKNRSFLDLAAIVAFGIHLGKPIIVMSEYEVEGVISVLMFTSIELDNPNYPYQVLKPTLGNIHICKAMLKNGDAIGLHYKNNHYSAVESLD